MPDISSRNRPQCEDVIVASILLSCYSCNFSSICSTVSYALVWHPKCNCHATSCICLAYHTVNGIMLWKFTPCKRHIITDNCCIIMCDDFIINYTLQQKYDTFVKLICQIEESMRRVSPLCCFPVLPFRQSTSLLGEPGSPSIVVLCGCAFIWTMSKRGVLEIKFV